MTPTNKATTVPRKKYAVTISRNLTEGTVIELMAEDEEHAQDWAMAKLSDQTDTNWIVDEGSGDDSEPYVSAVNEVPPNNTVEEEMETGQLWFHADTQEEFVKEITKLHERGATILHVKKYRDGIIGYTFEIQKSRAMEILGYQPEDEEWLTCDEPPTSD